MQWVTFARLHLDRVATPWLIRRFVDPDAEFLFLESRDDPERPEGAIPFALPGAELGPHDAAGSTFRKVIEVHGLRDQALLLMADIVEAGIAHSLGGAGAAVRERPEGVGLAALSVGMRVHEHDDRSILLRSEPLYDALYAYCAVTLIEEAAPDVRTLAPAARLDILRERVTSWQGDPP